MRLPTILGTAAFVLLSAFHAQAAETAPQLTKQEEAAVRKEVRSLMTRQANFIGGTNPELKITFERRADELRVHAVVWSEVDGQRSPRLGGATAIVKRADDGTLRLTDRPVGVYAGFLETPANAAASVKHRADADQVAKLGGNGETQTLLYLKGRGDENPVLGHAEVANTPGRPIVARRNITNRVLNAALKAHKELSDDRGVPRARVADIVHSGRGVEVSVNTAQAKTFYRVGLTPNGTLNGDVKQLSRFPHAR